MLKVPELKPGQTPYDPTLTPILNPSTPNPTPPTPSNTPSPTDLLNHCLVKNAVTSLHIEEETHFASLASIPPSELPTMLETHQKFLENQKNKHLNLLPTQTQKQLFLTMTKDYFTHSSQRAHSLHIQKIHEFHRETVEAQNAEFLARALAPETLFDDKTQTAYRDMILLNLENLLHNTPTKTRQHLLSQAAATLYRKIIEKRIETDPHRTHSILSSPTVKKTLTPAELTHYKTLANTAIRHHSLKTTAQSWIDENITPATAKQRTTQQNIPQHEKDQLLAIFTHLHHNENRKQVLTTLKNAMTAWETVTTNGSKPEAIPSWVTHTNPELHDFLIAELKTRETTGGLPPTPDYTRILDLVDDPNLQTIMSTFTSTKKLYDFIGKTGGLDSPSFGVALRFLLGSLKEDDQTWLDHLRQAHTHFLTHSMPDTNTNPLLHTFNTIRQTRMANKNGAQLDALEIQAILNEMQQPKE